MNLTHSQVHLGAGLSSSPGSHWVPRSAPPRPAASHPEVRLTRKCGGLVPRSQLLALPRRGLHGHTGHIPSLQCSEPSVAPASLGEGTRSSPRPTGPCVIGCRRLPLSPWLAWPSHRRPHASSDDQASPHQQSHTRCLLWFSMFGWVFFPFSFMSE